MAKRAQLVFAELGGRLLVIYCYCMLVGPGQPERRFKIKPGRKTSPEIHAASHSFNTANPQQHYCKFQTSEIKLGLMVCQALNFIVSLILPVNDHFKDWKSWESWDPHQQLLSGPSASRLVHPQSDQRSKLIQKPEHHQKIIACSLALSNASRNFH